MLIIGFLIAFTLAMLQLHFARGAVGDAKYLSMGIYVVLLFIAAALGITIIHDILKG